MAIKQVPVIDAAEATQQINYFEEGDSTISPVARILGHDGNPVTSGNPLPATDPRDLRGLAEDRPAASSGNLGWTYWAVDSGDIFVSTGSNWRLA